MNFLETSFRGTKPRLRVPLPGFDPVFYRYWYRDVRSYRPGPLRHYLCLGWREGRDPSAGFSTRGYLAANTDVANAGVNPLIHFLEFGLTEGRGGWQKDPSKPPPAAPLAPAMKLLAPPRKDEPGPA